ncbi:MAG: hypothetical protein JXA24_07775 [Proteobacteria bacterium]|nr:hypothetical protein [Pseudomonadota bacterium]
MKRLRPLPENPPTDKRALAKWADAWVGNLKGSGGICRYASGNWGMYFGQSPRPGSGTVSSAEASVPKDTATPEKAPAPAPTPIPAPPAKEGDDEGVFSPADILRSVESFIDETFTPKFRDKYGVALLIGGGGLILLSGGLLAAKSLVIRRRRAAAPATAPGEHPPTLVDPNVPRAAEPAEGGVQPAAAPAAPTKAELKARREAEETKRKQEAEERKRAEEAEKQRKKKEAEGRKRAEEAEKQRKKQEAREAKRAEEEERARQKAARKAGKAGKAAEPARAHEASGSTTLNSAEYQAAVRMQRMLAVHDALLEIEEYRAFEPVSRIQIAKLIAEADISRPFEAGGIKAVPITSSDKTVWMVGADANPKVEIDTTMLFKSESAWEIVDEMEMLMRQVRRVKRVDSSSADLRPADDAALARALYMDMKMAQADGSWSKVLEKYPENRGELRGPMPPQWIIIRFAETGWGVEGKGDPLLDQRIKLPPRSADPAPKRGEVATQANSAFIAQLISTEWFRELGNTDREVVLARQRDIDSALQIAYRDDAFKRMFVEGRRISEDGLRQVVSEVFDAFMVDVNASEGLRSLRITREKDARRPEWAEKYRELVRPAGVK